jgi:mono/diheme cytochrome c family protein
MGYLKAIAPRFSATGREPRRPVAIPFAPRDLDSPGRVALGKDLFGKWGCTSCHGSKGNGDGPLANVLQDIWGFPVRPRDLVHAPLHAGEAPEDTFRVLTVGVEGTPMPSFGAALGDPERWALVAFVRDLRKGGTP